ncbi:MAG: HipA domain-containing protein [Terracidiphilus sp.]
MAELFYGHVYFLDRFAGVLRQETGERCSFTYDSAYLDAGSQPVSMTLPLTSEPQVYEGRLHPFFDNLLAEGRQAAVQARWLGVRVEDRFARLLAFGGDCIGAVTIRDPKPREATGEPPESAEDIAALESRASISGVQAKLLAVKAGSAFRPARRGELSTHIAKLPSGNLSEVVELEHLSTQAARVLLTDDEIVETEIAPLEGIAERCLMIRRFDRVEGNGAIGKRHFEEFNQVLGRVSEDKYRGAYGDMADVMRKNPRCSPIDVEKLFRRILVCILLGNNDAHMKNFGLLYAEDRLRLAPFYDVLAVGLYPEYSRTPMALRLMSTGTNPTSLAGIGRVHLVELATSFGLKNSALREAAQDLGKRIENAREVVREMPHGSKKLRENFADYMRKRWNGTLKEITGSTGRG